VSKTLDQARRLLESRLNEVEDEANRLRRAISSLSEGSAGAAAKSSPSKLRAGRSARSKPRAKPRAKRARRGEREGQLLASIKAHPENSVSQHARAIGVSPQQAYPLLKRLGAAGRIEKTASGYRATAK
jgi:hypothetical protein